jgi:hypothetical protein
MCPETVLVEGGGDFNCRFVDSLIEPSASSKPLVRLSAYRQMRRAWVARLLHGSPLPPP